MIKSAAGSLASPHSLVGPILAKTGCTAGPYVHEIRYAYGYDYDIAATRLKVDYSSAILASKYAF